MPDTAGNNSTSVPWSYVPMDFRIPIFYGEITSPNDLCFAEWKAEIEFVFKAWRTPEDQKAAFVVRYLGGEAKREVLVMDKRDKYDDVITLLERIYGDKLSVATVLSKFYGRNQGALEGVRNYALSLQELSKRIPQGSSESISDISLRDRFVDGLRNSTLKSELRKMIRLKPTVTFSEIKDESLAIALERNGLEQEMETVTQLHRVDDERHRPSSKESVLHELKTAIEQVQEQIKELGKQIDVLKSNKSHNKQRYFKQPRLSRPIICFACHGEGHIARQCLHRYTPPPRPSAPSCLNKEPAEHASQTDELKSQVLTPQKLELIKLKSEDMEQPLRNRLNQVCEDLERFREGYNKLRNENTFLKLEFEHEQAERKRILDEMSVQYEAEVESLRKDKEILIARYSQHNDQEEEKMRNLHRENAQLNLKVKGLLSELNEIRDQREQVGLQFEHVSRLQSMQLSENTANIYTLETEKEYLKLHMDQLQKDFASSQDKERNLNKKIHDLERQNSELRGQLEEAVYQKKLELTNARMEAVKVKGELNREKDELLSEFEEIKAKLEIAENSLQTQSNLVAEKEKHIVRKVQAVKEDKWETVGQLETEKLDSRAKFQEMEKLHFELESKTKQQRNELEERIHEAEKRQDDAERDVFSLKTKFEQQRSWQDDLESEKQQVRRIRGKLQHSTAELQSTRALEKQVNHEIEKYRGHDVEDLKDQLGEVKCTAKKTVDASDQRKLNWFDENQRLPVDFIIPGRRESERERDDKWVQRHYEKDGMKPCPFPIQYIPVCGYNEPLGNQHDYEPMPLRRSSRTNLGRAPERYGY